MSVERVGISKKSENHIQKKSTPFLWTSFQGVGKSPPGWDFPPTSLLLRGVGFQPGGREFPPPKRLIGGDGGGFPPHPLHPIKNFHMTTKTITTPVTVTITVTIWICF